MKTSVDIPDDLWKAAKDIIPKKGRISEQTVSELSSLLKDVG